MSEKEKDPNSWFRNRFDFALLQSVLSDLSHFVALERLGPKVTERIAWRANIDEPKIALTFDDGPDPRFTPQLLKVLQEFEVRATFFLIGKHLEAHFDLAQEIRDRGHEVGNHTFTHPLLPRLEDGQIVEEIARTDDLLKSLDGAQPRFLRPPMGLFSKRVLDLIQASGYKTVVGDVYPRDSHLPGKDKIVMRVLRRVINGSIIILHDGGNSHNFDRSDTIAAVQKLIPKLRSRGFEFVTLSELLSD
ncbi:polysaccharide deacetylase family protein [candidate division KSB1 bacterium]|nr:polysaccharide deacetylase family protein [candidate division KSB1 bacterium]NIR72693.1 polysaccharide deacetylase family protein [candidate division KSB1 bacterium]NIS26778.1 polysaccharide deacetylase family protein [candidate division KSB1 bacterium]NIT73572.1 polysaccharide deacetylase family protein [candidate division KSB1 bacterium]NIU27448.1 polysaccharide deacetylase family protein [candidate division KSB1 bacterium]